MFKRPVSYKKSKCAQAKKVYAAYICKKTKVKNVMLNDEKELGARALNKDRSDKKWKTRKKVMNVEKALKIMTRDKERKAEKEKIVKFLMSKAEFGHVPVCSYDKTAE